jgi:hypothetical protein
VFCFKDFAVDEYWRITGDVVRRVSDRGNEQCRIWYYWNIKMDALPMKAVELIGDIDDQHRLRAQVPPEFPAGPVRLIVLLPDEDEGGIAWARGVAKEWADELGDPRQDIYTLEDGQPLDAAR